jgi:FkbM family methyltransferase
VGERASGGQAVQASRALVARATGAVSRRVPAGLLGGARRVRRRITGGDELATLADLEACYRLFLGRQPDEYGYQTYGPPISEGRLTVTELSSMFLASSEFRRRATQVLGWREGAPERIELSSGEQLYVRSDDSVIGAAVKQRRDYEPHVVRRLREVLQPGMTFVDVGASFGYYTVIGGGLVGPSGRVIACEPGPQNVSVLLLNVATHHLANATVHPVAVSDSVGVLLYHGSGGNGQVAPFSGQPDELAAGTLVPTRTLDDLLWREPRVDAVKIDVEGAEGRVIEGAKETLRRHRPALFFEFSPPGLEVTSGCSGEALLSGLAELGYRFEVLGPRSARRSEWSTVAQVLQRFEAAAGADHIDVLARDLP